MKVIGERRGRMGTLPCDNCEGKTGCLHVVEKDGKTSEICTSCKSVMNLIKEDKGGVLGLMVSRIWKHKTGEEFKSKI